MQMPVLDEDEIYVVVYAVANGTLFLYVMVGRLNRILQKKAKVFAERRRELRMTEQDWEERALEEQKIQARRECERQDRELEAYEQALEDKIQKEQEELEEELEEEEIAERERNKTPEQRAQEQAARNKEYEAHRAKVRQNAEKYKNSRGDI